MTIPDEARRLSAEAECQLFYGPGSLYWLTASDINPVDGWYYLHIESDGTQWVQLLSTQQDPWSCIPF